ncbi:MAG: hypothetical protein JWQ00_3048 [Noviherbaspirillum sp.]|jgi:hypothetical protein|nr:hypothetical protein [Noviherbaspirillum sp.]
MAAYGKVTLRQSDIGVSKGEGFYLRNSKLRSSLLDASVSTCFLHTSIEFCLWENLLRLWGLTKSAYDQCSQGNGRQSLSIANLPQVPPIGTERNEMTAQHFMFNPLQGDALWLIETH